MRARISRRVNGSTGYNERVYTPGSSTTGGDFPWGSHGLIVRSRPPYGADRSEQVTRPRRFSTAPVWRPLSAGGQSGTPTCRTASRRTTAAGHLVCLDRPTAQQAHLVAQGGVRRTEPSSKSSLARQLQAACC